MSNITITLGALLAIAIVVIDAAMMRVHAARVRHWERKIQAAANEREERRIKRERNLEMREVPEGGEATGAVMFLAAVAVCWAAAKPVLAAAGWHESDVEVVAPVIGCIAGFAVAFGAAALIERAREIITRNV